MNLDELEAQLKATTHPAVKAVDSPGWRDVGEPMEPKKIERPRVGGPHILKGWNGWDWVDGLAGSPCVSCGEKLTRGDLFCYFDLSAHCEACALHEGKKQPWVEEEGLKVGRRPLHPTEEDMCPRCKKSWYLHNGWNCSDGGVWPE